MKKVAQLIVKYRIWILVLFVLFSAYSIYGMTQTQIEYSVESYLPQNTDTKQALDIMDREFTTYGTATMMIRNVTYQEAKELHDQIAALPGVKEFKFANTTDYYAQSCALFNITFDGTDETPLAVAAYEQTLDLLQDYDLLVSHSLVDNYAAELQHDINFVLLLAIGIIILVLAFTSKSLGELPVFLLTFGVAALLNMGTNFWLGKISFISNSVCVILQLALAIDYAIILCQRFAEEKGHGLPPKEAMATALAKAIPEIAGSSLTTISGLLALTTMALGLGRDLGLVLAKSIVISMLCVFLFMPSITLLFSKAIDKTTHRDLVPRISWVGKFSIKCRYAIVAVFCVLAILCGVFSFQTTYVYSTSSIDSDRPSVTQTATHEIEQIFGYSNQLAVLVPYGDYDLEKRVLNTIDAHPEINSALGISNVEITANGYTHTLTEPLNYKQFALLLGTDDDTAAKIYAAYAYLHMDDNKAGMEEVALFEVNREIYTASILAMCDCAFAHDDFIHAALYDNNGALDTYQDLRDQIQDAERQLVGINYTRLVFNIDGAVESASTFTLLEQLRAEVKALCPGAIFAGDSMSSYDLNASFSTDNIVVSVLTLVFVFIVLMFTFRSWGIPIPLTLTIQSAIFINFSYYPLLHTNLYFFVYLIVSAIQMGATIDYAIVFTNRYGELSTTMNKKQAAVEALNQSFPTILTSGSILALAGFLIGTVVSDPLIATLGLCLGRGVLISIASVMLVLPAITILTDKWLAKTNFTLPKPKLFAKLKKRTKGGNKDEKIFKQGIMVLLLAVVFCGVCLGGNVAAPLTATAVTPATITISNLTDFMSFVKNCNATADYSQNLTVDLVSDLDFRGTTVTPIRNFAGTLHGNNHTLSNLTITDGTECTARFDTVMYTATIEQLQITNVKLDGDRQVALIGTNYGTLREISISGNIKGVTRVAGLVAINGYNADDTDDDEENDDQNFDWHSQPENYAQIIDCENHATITGQNIVGGIAGINHGIVLGCDNYGDLSGKKHTATASVVNVGGIAGNNTYRVVDCANYGRITTTDSSAVGGICGLASGEIYYAFNHAAVQGNRYVGGICGLYGVLETDDNQDLDLATHRITYALNDANITATGVAGGIVGATPVTRLTLANAASTGNITVMAGNYAGGIIGNQTNGSITSCLSAGSITATGLNAGQYVGGIAGTAGDIKNCYSIAAIQGNNYLGGICGLATGELQSCYTNALLVLPNNCQYYGLIAGKTTAFDAANNTFGEHVKGNYYLGNQGGIYAQAYGTLYNDAAQGLTNDELSSTGTLPTAVQDHFANEYWQGNTDGGYPVLSYFTTVQANDAYSDADAWASLFTAHQDTFSALTQDTATTAYTIVFREWQQSNGDLYDEDGHLQTDNFTTIATVRLSAGSIIKPPAFAYATADANGRLTYQGDDAKYWVAWPQLSTTDANMTIDAVYTPIYTTIKVTDDTVSLLLEGEFTEQTVATIAKDGDYFTLAVTDNGQAVPLTNVIVKVKTTGQQNTVYQWDGVTETKVAVRRTGDYLAFNYQGGYFRVGVDDSGKLPWWAWLLIGPGAAATVATIITATVLLTRKHRRQTKGTPTPCKDKKKH